MNVRENFVHAFEASVATNPMYSLFRTLPVCSELDLPESMLLFSCFDAREIAAGTTIYEAGTASENVMYLVLAGEAAVASSWHDTYVTLKAGDVFGLFSFLDEGRNHSATVRASTDLTVLTISRPYFDVITLEDPALGNQMLRFMFRLLSRMSLKLESEYAAIHHYATGRRI